MTDIILPEDFHNWPLSLQRQWLGNTGDQTYAAIDALHGEYLARLLGIPPGYCTWDSARQHAWWFWSEEAWHIDAPSLRSQLDEVSRLITNEACRNPADYGLDDPNDNVAMLSAVGDFAFDLGLFGGANAFVSWKRAHPTTAVASYVGAQAGSAIGGVIGPAGQAAPHPPAHPPAPHPATTHPAAPRPATHARGPRRVPRRRRRPARINTSLPRGAQISLVTHSVPETPATTTAAPVWPWVLAGVAALGLGYLAYRQVTRASPERRDVGVRDMRTGRMLRA